MTRGHTVCNIMTIFHFDIAGEISGSVIVCMIYLVIQLNIILIIVLDLVGVVTRRCIVPAKLICKIIFLFKF